MDFRIRNYSKSDENQVLNIFRLNTPTFFDSSEEQDLVVYLDQEIEDYFLVEENGEVLGCGGINYLYDQQSARLSWDFLHPESQGKGIGRALVQYRLNKIAKNSRIKTVVVRTSQMADKFYQKMGFSLVSVKKDYWAKGFDLYEMSQSNNC